MGSYMGNPLLVLRSCEWQMIHGVLLTFFCNFNIHDGTHFFTVHHVNVFYPLCIMVKGLDWKNGFQLIGDFPMYDDISKYDWICHQKCRWLPEELILSFEIFLFCWSNSFQTLFFWFPCFIKIKYCSIYPGQFSICSYENTCHFRLLL